MRKLQLAGTAGKQRLDREGRHRAHAVHREKAAPQTTGAVRSQQRKHASDNAIVGWGFMTDTQIVQIQRRVYVRNAQGVHQGERWIDHLVKKQFKKFFTCGIR